ncbi:ribonuclease H-like domain-containing protein [Tanacetum coccineum]
MVAVNSKGIDCDETFSPVVKPATIRTILSLAVSRDWPIHQLDVKNAFLHGQLSETHSLYGLKQAPRVWFQWFASFITRVSFQHSKTDASLFVYHQGSDIAYLLLYVDDIILIASSTALLQHIITLLHKEILERAHMAHCNPYRTLVDTESKLGSDGDLVCLYMHDPREPHFTALKHILRYVRGTIDHGLQLYISSTIQLTAYTDVDWAGCPAEYHGVANVVAETAWIRNLLLELHTSLAPATLVYCDNVSAMYLSNNPVQHQRIKHIEIDIHFVRDYVASGQVRVLHVPSRFQYADIFTKGLPSALFLVSLQFERLKASRSNCEGVWVLLVRDGGLMGRLGRGGARLGRRGKGKGVRRNKGGGQWESSRSASGRREDGEGRGGWDRGRESVGREVSGVSVGERSGMRRGGRGEVDKRKRGEGIEGGGGEYEGGGEGKGGGEETERGGERGRRGEEGDGGVGDQGTQSVGRVKEE